ncbi:hypothetical protein AgCh_025145 [Apium graveolens]
MDKVCDHHVPPRAYAKSSTRVPYSGQDFRSPLERHDRKGEEPSDCVQSRMNELTLSRNLELKDFGRIHFRRIADSQEAAVCQQLANCPELSRLLGESLLLLNRDFEIPSLELISYYQEKCENFVWMFTTCQKWGKNMDRNMRGVGGCPMTIAAFNIQRFHKY